MTSGEGRRIEPDIGNKNVRPAVSVEIGDKDLTRVNGFGHLTGDYLCGTVHVTTSGLTTRDDGGTPHRANGTDNIWNPVTVKVSVGNRSRIPARPIPKRVQNGFNVE